MRYGTRYLFAATSALASLSFLLMMRITPVLAGQPHLWGLLIGPDRGAAVFRLAAEGADHGDRRGACANLAKSRFPGEHEPRVPGTPLNGLSGIGAAGEHSA